MTEPKYLRCRVCHKDALIVETAYGHRAACFTCGIRWTRIRGERGWTAEPR